MTHRALSVNDAEAFLSGFENNIFIRLLHDGYDRNTREPRRLRPRHFYGNLSAVLDYLDKKASRLNDGSDDEHKFQVFYCVNDPGQGGHALNDDIGAIRVIYQDCDDPEHAAAEPELDGQQSHAVVESSPGKRQRIWHIEAPGIDPHRQRAIHDHMCARVFHDPQAQGQARLLRLPGFRNWKYPDGPVSKLLVSRAVPRLTRERVFKAFGFHHADERAGNLERAAQRIQNSGDLPDHKVYDLERERAKRQGIKDGDKDTEARARDAHDIAPGQLKTDTLLNALSLIEPDSHRNEWRRVIGALDYMAGGRDWGIHIAEAWSAQGLQKYDAKAFAKEWRGLNSRDVANPSSWLTIKRITDNKRHDKQTRALRNCETFKRFEEKFGPVLDYEQRTIEYPVLIKIETADGPLWRPDARARRNVERLLELEATEVYYNEFAQMAVVKIDGAAQEIDQKLIMELYSTAHVTGLRIDDAFLTKQIEAMALDVKYDPVRNYLDKLPMWDGKERLRTVLQRHMGAPDTPSVREIMPLMMIAMIRRTFKPGFKFDLMPIFEGKQELGKTSLFRVLMPSPDWFGEGPKMDEEAKRLLSQLSGKLVIEFGELVGMRKIDIGSLKKLITQQTDEYTANYARKKTRVPRRCIFVGTVNNSQYLRDLTGNRRFPIIPVTIELDQAEFIKERDQLWAEALLEESFIDELRFSKEAEDDMRVIQETRLDVNTETTEFMNEMAQFTTGWMTTEVIWQRLGIPFNERSKRVGNVQYLFREIKDILERDGWTWNGVMRDGNKSIRAIYRKSGRGQAPEIICNGGVLCLAKPTDNEPTESTESIPPIAQPRSGTEKKEND